MDIWPWLAAGALVVSAAIFAAMDAALSQFSVARAREIVEDEERLGAHAVLRIANNKAWYLNTALLLRLLSEIGAIVIVTVEMQQIVDSAVWGAVIAVAVMLVVSFVAIGVAPRTIGRQHHERVALATGGVLVAVTTVLGPVPKLLIVLGNALTPGRGFSEGPFSNETELREMVDLAEASSVIEAGERKMIHSVFELGDTIAREVMVPRTDVLYIEQSKNLRQAMSLFLRSGFSRLPVVADNLDQVMGFVYLKDIAQRDFEAPDVETTEKIDGHVRPPHFVPDTVPVDTLLADMQARRQHIAVVIDEYGGTAGLITIEDILEEIVGEITDEYDADEVEPQRLKDEVVRVSSRFPIDDLDELVGIEIDDEDVDTILGLLTKHLGRVPIPGASVVVEGMRLEAERSTGRRNQIGTVLVSAVEREPESDGAEEDD